MSEASPSDTLLINPSDLCILPFAVLLYLSAYLDRGNLANARLQGLQEEVLDGSDTNCESHKMSETTSTKTARFHRLVMLLCHLYCLLGALNSRLLKHDLLLTTQIPGTLLAKAINPSYSIAFGAITWSIAATCQAAAVNRGGIFACRLFVGIGEAMFGQAMAFHLSLWYTKKDLAKRIGLFISAGALSGAFGGLIAFGVNSMKHTKIEPWRILFLIEGCPSLLLAICVALFMPSRPESSRLLNEDERTLCLTRLNEENTMETGTGIDWRGVRRTFTDPKAYVISMGWVHNSLCEPVPAADKAVTPA